MAPADQPTTTTTTWSGEQYNPWGVQQAAGGGNGNYGMAQKGVGKQGLFEEKKKLSRKLSDKYEKTKVVAASSVKKVKEGASSSANWMKIKYNTLTSKK